MYVKVIFDEERAFCLFIARVRATLCRLTVNLAKRHSGVALELPKRQHNSVCRLKAGLQRQSRGWWGSAFGAFDPILNLFSMLPSFRSALSFKTLTALPDPAYLHTSHFPKNPRIRT